MYAVPSKGQQQAVDYDTKWVLLPEVSAYRYINTVFQDRYGMLWIGSKSGLYRYNGISAQTHHISQSDTVFDCPIRAIQEDEAGNLWIATEKGLKIIDPTRSRLLPLATLNLPASFEKLNKINLTNGPDGSLYLAFGKYLYNYCSNQLNLLYTLPVEDDYDPVLFKYSPNERFILLNNMPLFARRLIVVELGGAIFLNPPLYNSEGHLIFNEVNFNDDIFFIQTDSLDVFLPHWVNDERVMIKLHYDRTRKGFVYLERENWNVYTSQQVAFIRAIMQEKKFINTGGFTSIQQLAHGLDVYVGQEGLFLLKPKEDYFQPVKASLGQQIRAIQGDRYGHLIYGTYSGTYWQRPEEQQAHQLTGGYQPCWMIHPENANRTRFLIEYDMDCKYWIHLQGTSKGVSIEQKKALFTFDEKHINSPYLSLAEDTLRNGIWHYLRDSEGCFQLMFYDKQEDKHYYLNKICNAYEPRNIIANKDLWIAGELGLKRFLNPDPKSGSLREDKQSIPNVFKNSFILTLYSDTNGQFWICPDGKGLFRYQPETGKYEQFTSMEGLPDNSVYSILGEPGDSVLWLGTGKGLSRFDVRKRIFENYYTEDGLTHNEFNTAAAYRAPDGIMYMGGQNGITRFNPADFKRPEVALRQNAHVLFIGSKGGREMPHFILCDGASLLAPTGSQPIQITFHTDDYLRAERQQFRYRIPGLINEWQYLNYNDKALFPYLPAGEYHVEVQVQTYRGIWQAPVRYTLNVLPYWYETWWFRLLIVLCAGILLYSLYRLRIRFLRREFDLRQQISHDLHDSLGSKIYLLRALSNRISNPLVDDSEKAKQLDKFEEISHDAFKTIRDFIWAFDPKQDEISQLFSRMDDFAENYLSPIIERVNIVCDEVPENHKIGPRAKHHLMSIYQEILTNMVRHTASQTITIRLSLKANEVNIHIANKHNGYRTHEDYTGAGLRSGIEKLRHRLKEIHARLDLTESDLQSQEVSISFEPMKA